MMNSAHSGLPLNAFGWRPMQSDVQSDSKRSRDRPGIKKLPFVTLPAERKDAAKLQTDKEFIWHNARIDNYANHMIEYLAALRLKQTCPNMKLSNFQIPQFGLNLPPLDADDDVVTFVSEHPFRFDFNRITHALKSPRCRRVETHCYAQRMEYLPNVEHCRSAFASMRRGTHSFGPRDVVCPIRGNEVLREANEDYVQLPVGFYEELFSSNGFDPIFMGQINANPYCDELRRRIKGAWFLPSLGPDADFEAIRSAQRLVLPVSTFAWLGAWLSNATEVIMPMIGLYNRLQCPTHDLLPVSDRRYVFYEFPIFKAVPEFELMSALSSIEGSWKRVESHKLAAI